MQVVLTLQLSSITPRCCAAAGCSSVSDKRYSLHEFPRDDALRANLMGIGCKTAAIWLERTYIQWRLSFAVSISRPTVSYEKELGTAMLLESRLKPNAVPTIFPNPLYTPSQRPASKRRKRKAVI